MTNGKTYRLERITDLPATLEEAWAFFSDPANLAVLTPPEMDFQIKTKLRKGEFYTGMRIAYTVSPFGGIRLKWVSEIVAAEHCKQFTDIQVAGPYAYWEHKHVFEETPTGVRMRDIVDYRMPFGIFGRGVHRLFVRRRLKRIFDFREEKIRFLFSAGRVENRSEENAASNSITIR